MARRAKVLWLIKGLGLGGAERLLTAAVPYLSRDEFEYEVAYFLPWKDALEPELTQAGIKVTCFGTRSPLAVRVVWRVSRYLRDNGVDVLHAHLPWASIVGRAAARMARVPAVVYTEHGCWDRLNPLTRFLNRRTLGWNDLTIAVSDEVRQSMTGLNGQPVTTIDNGIDCETLARTPSERQDVCVEFGIPSTNCIVIKVANLSPVKRHELLIEAFARFANKIPDSSLLLVGQLRNRKQRLEKLASDLGVGNKVVITGPRTDVLRLVKSADIFAMSSKSEGLPVSLLEAMGLGKPVVCTAVGGIAKVVRDGVDGFLVPPENPQALARGLVDLATNPRLCKQMGEAGAQRVRDNYDISVMVGRVENEYRRILQDKRSVGRVCSDSKAQPQRKITESCPISSRPRLAVENA